MKNLVARKARQYLVCNCSGAQCQRGSWYFRGLNDCSRPEVGIRWGSLCVWAPELVGELHDGHTNAHIQTYKPKSDHIIEMKGHECKMNLDRSTANLANY